MREQLVKIATKLGIYQQMVKIDTRHTEHLQKKAMKRYGLQTILEADAVVSDFGGHLFLVFGSLLGAYREHNFIPHDYDIDMGLLSSERPDDMVSRMQDRGFKLIRQQYIKEIDRITEEQYSWNGVGIDIFYFFDDRNADEIYTYISYRHETKDWREANVTDGFPAILKILPSSTFIRQDFLGHPIYMPQDTEAWLKKLYGEHFMTPDPNWTLGDHKARAVPSQYRVYRRMFD